MCNANLSITWPNMTCPLPQAPATCVLSLDQAMLKMLPVFGFSSAWDHCHHETWKHTDKHTSITSNHYIRRDFGLACHSTSARRLAKLMTTRLKQISSFNTKTCISKLENVVIQSALFAWITGGSPQSANEKAFQVLLNKRNENERL